MVKVNVKMKVKINVRVKIKVMVKVMIKVKVKVKVKEAEWTPDPTRMLYGRGKLLAPAGNQIPAVKSVAPLSYSAFIYTLKYEKNIKEKIVERISVSSYRKIMLFYYFLAILYILLQSNVKYVQTGMEVGALRTNIFNFI
jgi:hypothetical protein